MDCCALGTIGKLLERRCLKWAYIAHLDIWNTSYGQKKGRESNWQFDSRPLKVGNRPLLDVRFESATRRWKTLDESYNFASDHIVIELCSREISASKVPGLQPGVVSGLPLGSPGKNSHLDATSAASYRVYYKGEGGGFPQVWAVVSLVCPCCPWLILAPKVLQLCTNHLCGLCAGPCEWISLSIPPSPIPELQHAPLPLQVLWARERLQVPTPFALPHTWNPQMGLQGTWECVIKVLFYHGSRSLPMHSFLFPWLVNSNHACQCNKSSTDSLPNWFWLKISFPFLEIMASHMATFYGPPTAQVNEKSPP
jgi:hypothetical protein